MVPYPLLWPLLQGSAGAVFFGVRNSDCGIAAVSLAAVALRLAEDHRGTTSHPACGAEQMHAPTFLEYGGKVGQRGRDAVLDFNPPAMIYRPNSRRTSIPYSEIRIPNLRVPYPLTLTLSLGERESRSRRMNNLNMHRSLSPWTHSTTDAKDSQTAHNPLSQPQNRPPLPSNGVNFCNCFR